MIQPICLYAMPRSRGNAALQACVKSIDMGEAWNPRNFMPNSAVPPVAQSVDHMVTMDQIQSVLAKIDLADAKVKIMGQQLARLIAAQEWWAAAQAAGRHEIFVLERDYRTSLHSWLLAEHLGYFKHKQEPDRPVVATDRHVRAVRLILENHVKFYPRYGHRISWDQLPPHAFDKAQVTINDQDSLSRLNLIENLDWWQDQLDQLLADMNPGLDACKDSLPYWYSSK